MSPSSILLLEPSFSSGVGNQFDPAKPVWRIHWREINNNGKQTVRKKLIKKSQGEKLLKGAELLLTNQNLALN